MSNLNKKDFEQDNIDINEIAQGRGIELVLPQEYAKSKDAIPEFALENKQQVSTLIKAIPDTQFISIRGHELGYKSPENENSLEESSAVHKAFYVNQKQRLTLPAALVPHYDGPNKPQGYAILHAGQDYQEGPPTQVLSLEKSIKYPGKIESLFGGTPTEYDIWVPSFDMHYTPNSTLIIDQSTHTKHMGTNPQNLTRADGLFRFNMGLR